MIELQKFDVLAVRAAINALVIVWCRTPKGRRRLNEAIELLQAQAMAAQITPISGIPATLDRTLLDEGVLYLETLRLRVEEARLMRPSATARSRRL